jgi:ADP-ribosylglycohydrolase
MGGNMSEIDYTPRMVEDEVMVEAGGLAIALAAFYAVNNDTDNLLEKIWVHLPDSKVKVSIYGLESLVNSDKITPQQALRVLGTKADVRETVPSALYCFIKSTSYHQSILHAIKAGARIGNYNNNHIGYIMKYLWHQILMIGN